MGDKLEIIKSIEELQMMYKDSISSKYFRALVYGDSGTGKTYLSRTCRRPVLVHSFDSGGTKTVRDCIEEGWMVVDNRYETEDPKNPTAWVLWEKEYFKAKKSGLFEIFGTLVIDSATTMNQAIMNAVMKKGGHAGGIPVTGEKGKDNDYVLQMTWLENAIKDLFSLPCDVIFTAHPDITTDEQKKMFIGPLLTGQSKIRIPLMFDEMYSAQSSKTSTGIKYALLTQNSGMFRAKSRFSNKGQFKEYEEPDIKKLLKKAGYSIEDKPIPWLVGKEVNI